MKKIYYSLLIFILITAQNAFGASPDNEQNFTKLQQLITQQQQITQTQIKQVQTNLQNEIDSLNTQLQAQIKQIQSQQQKEIQQLQQQINKIGQTKS